MMRAAGTIVVLGVACLAHTGGTLYGSSRDGELFTIDVSTGAGTLVGVMPFPSTEIEYNPGDGRAWCQQPDGVFTIHEFDIDTAAGIGDFVADGGSYTGLEYVGATLYGTVIYSGGGSAPSELRTLDPTTGASVLVGPTGVGAISGLAWEGSRMLGIAGGSGRPAVLYEIDLATGAATSLCTIEIQAGSLEFGPDGMLYAGGTGVDGGELHRIDSTVDCASTLVWSTGFPNVTGLTLRAAPEVPATSRMSTLALIVVLLFGLGVLRQARRMGASAGQR